MTFFLHAALVGSLVTAGCTAAKDAPVADQKVKQTNATKKAAKRMDLQPTPPTTNLVTLRDPVEDAYTMGMPKGWNNRTYSARAYDIHTIVDITVSPNGSVLIFQGDPSLPQYWSPSGANPVVRDIARIHPRMKIAPFQPANQYFPDYVKRKFGKLTGFKITSMKGDPEGEQKLTRRFVEAGANMRASLFNIRFDYIDKGVPMHAVVFGVTTDSGPFWSAGVTGITTTGDPMKYVSMIEAMGRSRQMNPNWQAAQARVHQQRMAQIQAFGQQLTAQHNQNMAWIQQSAQRHQERMQAIWAQGDASMKGYYDRMAAGDAQHQNFMNYINDENTVVGSGGKTYQVDNSYQRYFMNKSNHTYIGGDSTMDVETLRRFGLNPSDYEEVKVKR